MIDLTTYALLRKQITTAASGISDVRAEGDELVFVLADGHEVRVAIPATGIRDAKVRDDALVLTLADGQELVYTPITTVVDTTLTQSGQAADAKATGGAIGQLKDDLDDITYAVSDSDFIEKVTNAYPSLTFDADGYSQKIVILGDYRLSFDTATYTGDSSNSTVSLYEYDDNGNIVNSVEPLTFWRRNQEQFGKTPYLKTILFPYGGYTDYIVPQANTRYLKLKSHNANLVDRVPNDWTITQKIIGTHLALKKDAVKESGIAIGDLPFEEVSVSGNYFDKNNSTTETSVYLGRKNDGTELYGWYLTGPAKYPVAGTQKASNGLNSISARFRLDPGVYSRSPITVLSVFDSQDKLIEQFGTQTYESTVTVPAGAFYGRLSFADKRIESVMLAKAPVLPVYSPYIPDLEICSLRDYARTRDLLTRYALNEDYIIPYMEDISYEANKYVRNGNHTFMFISDTHTHDGLEYVESRAAMMSKYVPCSYIAHGGDICDGVSNDKEHELKLMSKMARSLRDANCPIYVVKGNHDMNAGYKGSASTVDDLIVNRDIYTRCNAYNRIINGDPNNLYFYVDDDESNIRTIFLNFFNRAETVIDGTIPAFINSTPLPITLQGAQYRWLVNEATDFSDKTNASEWGIITVSHRMQGAAVKIIGACNAGINVTIDSEETIGVDADGKDITEYITHNCAYAKQGPIKWIAAFVGDDHYDKLDVMELNGFTIPKIHILNASHARDNTSVPTADNGVLMPPVKVFGTENDTSFDIVTIDKSEHRIYLTRYGARSYAYNTDTSTFDKIVARTRIIDYTTATYIKEFD